ncbi:glutathionylspermidine synthase family protein [Limimaricola pyoseonensis]|uniref:Glutathionylspermidine synthase n=1 Tax=Limimaricola pyoseonensis TaxID=521013 RepID=A0A1G7A8X0_9RHOB|nr:glutathionylspermidine synthase family protein [Limimaricola pyoseonensis]SDE10927.1 Glutathionylspermidine synthase [Limimaricola pyoseonensis]
MQRIAIGARPDLAAKAEEAGFTFHHMHGEPYWDEETVYAFDLAEVEEMIEDPATELHAMCREAVDHVIRSEELMERLAIPEASRDFVAESWRAGEPELYGRFDLAHDGQGPAKLLEYNADTPTALYESAAFQWQWLEDMAAAGRLPEGADQFNGLHEALVARLQEIFAPDTDLHFACFADNPEDYATTEYMAWAAREAGLGAHFVPIPEIGLTTAGQLSDNESRVIGALFKLYPWEDMLRDDFAEALPGARCRFLEPPWKAVLSNKGILPVLWRLFEGHPNLLPAFFEDEADTPAARAALADGHVRKPLFSREGASVDIVAPGVEDRAADRTYDAHPKILQAYQPLPEFDGMHPVIGAWVVGQSCVGMGLREDRDRVTRDLSRFKPHFIRD